MTKKKQVLCTALILAAIVLIGFLAWKVLMPPHYTESELAQKRTQAAAYDNTFGGTALVFLAVRPDGGLQAVVPDGSSLDQQIAGWSNIVQADSPNTSTIVALQSDGGCLCVSDNAVLESEVRSWNDIAQITCGRDVVFGLKQDGTVVCAGDQVIGSEKIAEWKGVKSIFTEHSAQTVLALLDSGTLVFSSESEAECLEWNKVSYFGNGSFLIAGNNDGTANAWGTYPSVEDEVASWTDLVQVDMGSEGVVAGLRADGTVLVADVDGESYYQEVTTWPNIVDIAIYDGLILTLDAEGTVRIAGTSSGGNAMHFQGRQFDDCVAVFANDRLGCALRSDGSVIDFAYHASGKTMEPLW